MPAYISADRLRDLGACAPQVRKFVEIFGEGDVAVSESVALLYASVFDWDWAAGALLSAPAWEAYEATTAPAREAYKAATASAWEAYEAATAPAREAYKAATAPARGAYEAAAALAFVRLYMEG